MVEIRSVRRARRRASSNIRKVLRDLPHGTIYPRRLAGSTSVVAAAAGHALPRRELVQSNAWTPAKKHWLWPDETFVAKATYPSITRAWRGYHSTMGPSTSLIHSAFYITFQIRAPACKSASGY